MSHSEEQDGEEQPSTGCSDREIGTGTGKRRDARALSRFGVFRQKAAETQIEFWRRFGVTQSAGSRYELEGVPVPKPVQMLVDGFARGVLTAEVMEELGGMKVTRTPKVRRDIDE